MQLSASLFYLALSMCIHIQVMVVEHKLNFSVGFYSLMLHIAYINAKWRQNDTTIETIYSYYNEFNARLWLEITIIYEYLCCVLKSYIFCIQPTKYLFYFNIKQKSRLTHISNKNLIFCHITFIFLSKTYCNRTF